MRSTLLNYTNTRANPQGDLRGPEGWFCHYRQPVFPVLAKPLEFKECGESENPPKFKGDRRESRLAMPSWRHKRSKWKVGLVPGRF